MPLKNLEYWVVAQLALDLGLVLLVVIFICKLRSLGRPLRAGEPEGAVDAGNIAGLSHRMADLENRLKSWEGQLMNGAPPPAQFFTRDAAPVRDPSFSPGPDPGKSLRFQVEELAGRGMSPEEIARRLNLQLAEVQVALDLSRLLAKREPSLI